MAVQHRKNASPNPAAPPRNRLADSASPYLRQHADNPVAWQPWGPEALQRARTENRPIFLSIGYSACHWCHVMAHESFENAETAALLNRHFVCIKVDREERPDLDDYYMTACQLMTGGGGWPLTLFLTPGLKPFFAGTYFPPADRFGIPGFPRVAASLAKHWAEHPEEVLAAAESLTSALQQSLAPPEPDEGGTVTRKVVEGAIRQLAAQFDALHGGFGGAPKFPPHSALNLLLNEHARTGAPELLDLCLSTLGRMACGGIHDQAGGGFHRYAVDGIWLVPHFEKMLYDNALLAQSYLAAWQLAGQPFHRRVAEGVLECLLRDFRGPDGAFYASFDADSAGGEGAYYTWTPEELRAALGAEDAALAARLYTVTESGQLEGRSILHMKELPDAAAGVAAPLDRINRTLLAARGKRPPPGTDDKILANWNGLAVSALARAGRALGGERYTAAAAGAARFVLEQMAGADGTLMHSHARGQAEIPGFLDDYAAMACACLDLYEATFDALWLRHALRLAEEMTARFWDAETGHGFFFTAAAHAGPGGRQAPNLDSQTPSGSSLAALALLRLGRLLGDDGWTGKAETDLSLHRNGLKQHPHGWLFLADVAARSLQPPVELVVVRGAADSAADRALLAAVRGMFLPDAVLAGLNPGDTVPAALAPLFAGRTAIGGRTTVYLCVNHACQPPITDPDEFRQTCTRLLAPKMESA